VVNQGPRPVLSRYRTPRADRARSTAGLSNLGQASLGRFSGTEQHVVHALAEQRAVLGVTQASSSPHASRGRTSIPARSRSPTWSLKSVNRHKWRAGAAVPG